MSRPAADAGTMSGRAWTAILGAGLVILMSSCTGSPPVPPSQTTDPAGSGSTGDLSAVPGIVREVESSVVTIQTSGGIGSGVIYRSDGTIVTDAHVVEDQEKKPSKNVQIRFADGSEAPWWALTMQPMWQWSRLIGAIFRLPSSQRPSPRLVS
ncbi:hypothetical protein [Paenarthrobacter nitroguajacolicus]|uniref:hypothetical protein n=1 Tax=Paenarthrobacter nitroguajacolicus TaxID=211146 RepID=UPI00248CB47E|nr:hypothetical protein [Paenarthrobacter nitroguajacolicus]